LHHPTSQTVGSPVVVSSPVVVDEDSPPPLLLEDPSVVPTVPLEEASVSVSVSVPELDEVPLFVGSFVSDTEVTGIVVITSSVEVDDDPVVESVFAPPSSLQPDSAIAHPNPPSQAFHFIPIKISGGIGLAQNMRTVSRQYA